MSKPWTIAVAAIAVAAVALLSCGVYAIVRYKTYYAPSASMEPTIGLNWIPLSGQPVPNQPNLHPELVGRALVPSR